MKILVVRNDKLGDFVLALPTFLILKKSIPDAKITAFVPKYTADIANFVNYIDDVLLDTDDDIIQLSKKFKKFDVIISLFSTKKVAIASFLAKIPYRLVPATKIWQVFYNHRLTQRRSKSLKPEFEYNLDLARYFLTNINQTIAEQNPPFIKLSPNKKSNKLIIIHPGSGGSANNLSINQYAKVADLLYQKNHNILFSISAGPDEITIANQLSDKISAPSQVFISTKGLVEFCEYLNSAQLFIGGSTGPLHLAGAINSNTVGYYPNKRSATALRWQTLNDKNKRLWFSPENNSDDMNKIDLAKCADKIYLAFLSD